MSRYRKKPLVIEAFRLAIDFIPDWFMDKVTTNEIILRGGYRDLQAAEIKTLEGTMTADKGDYVIKGIKGEIYPCKPDIFEASYEAATSTPHPQQDVQGLVDILKECVQQLLSCRDMIWNPGKDDSVMRTRLKAEKLLKSYQEGRG